MTIKRIRIKPESTVREILASADVGPVLLEQDGDLYQVSRVTPSGNPFQRYDPAAARAALKRASRAFEGVNTEELKARLRAERSQADRPRP